MTTAQVTDLARWKLTLPTGAAEHPDEHQASELTTGKEWMPFYGLAPDGSIAFRAPVNGTTTSGSSYPRSELREMDKYAPTKPASWGGNDSLCHTMIIDEAFTALPEGKPHVVGGQIHDAADDFSVFRLEGSNLWLTLGDNTHYKLLMNNYVLGQRIVVAFQVFKGACKVFLNGNPVAMIDSHALVGGYFKAGCYTQARVGQPGVPGVSSNFGEVKIYRLKIAHTYEPGDIAFPDMPPVTPPPVDPPNVPDPPVVTPPPPVPASTRIIHVIRHGEKPKSKSDHTLNSTGLARAQALMGLFAPLDGVYRAGIYRPDRIYASKGNTASMRPLQTVQPLAQRMGLSIITKFDVEAAVSATAKELKAQTGVTLMSMEHSAIVAMCSKLGTSTPKIPSSWDSSRFDMVWTFVSTDGGKSWKFTQTPELLLAGDKSTPMK